MLANSRWQTQIGVCGRQAKTIGWQNRTSLYSRQRFLNLLCRSHTQTAGQHDLANICLS